MLDTVPPEVFDCVMKALYNDPCNDSSPQHTAAILCRTSKLLYERTVAWLYRSLSYYDVCRPKLAALLASKPALGYHVKVLCIGIEALSVPTGWSMRRVENMRRQMLANCLDAAAYCPRVTDFRVCIESVPDIFEEDLGDEDSELSSWTVHVCRLSCLCITVIDDLTYLAATGLATD